MPAKLTCMYIEGFACTLANKIWTKETDAGVLFVYTFHLHGLRNLGTNTLTLTDHYDDLVVCTHLVARHCWLFMVFAFVTRFHTRKVCILCKSSRSTSIEMLVLGLGMRRARKENILAAAVLIRNIIARAPPLPSEDLFTGHSRIVGSHTLFGSGRTTFG